MAVALSGTTAFNPPVTDLTIEAYARLLIRGPQLTQDHLQSARMSFNLVNSIFSNRGTNLWKVELSQITLPQGVATYTLPSDTIMILPEAFIRTYSLTNTANVTPQFSTAVGSRVVEIVQDSNGLSVDMWLNVNVPVSVGGIILFGFYQVTSITGSDSYTINADSPALATVVNGGVVPQFAVFQDSSVAQVILPNHGYLPGQTFQVQVSTTVSNITFYGPYAVQSVVDDNTFLVVLPENAVSDAQGYENGGLAQLVTQSTSALPVDRVIYPLSRADYSAIPNKSQQALPTSYWFDRLTTPTITVWPVPDANGPYQLNLYRFVQQDDVNMRGTQGADVPFRFLEAFIANVAAHLAMKWAQDKYQALQQYADRMFSEASDADREKVGFWFSPQLDGYFS